MNDRWWQQDGVFESAPASSYALRPPVHVGRYDADCACEQCALMFIMLTYMFEAMEPTDRALWPVPSPRVKLGRLS